MAARDDSFDRAADRVYAVAPQDFTATRKQVADELRKSGDADTAARVEKLRKPTSAAAMVNALVLSDASVVERLTELGDRLRAAQGRLDATELRDLTTERRKLVDDLTRRAFGGTGAKQPSVALRDEVSGTFEAAIAEPEVAARLGRLQKAEQWSGFGFLPAAAPQLTVVRGGRTAVQKAAPAKKQPAAPKKSAAELRREKKALADAQNEFDDAEAAFEDAVGDERKLGQRVKQLTARLAKLQSELDDARAELNNAHTEVAAAKTRRRDARAALDRLTRG